MLSQRTAKTRAINNIFHFIDPNLSDISAKSASGEEEDIQESDRGNSDDEKITDESSGDASNYTTIKNERYLWKKLDLVPPENTNLEFTALPDTLLSPLAYFRDFISDDMLSKTAEQTNTYYFVNNSIPCNISAEEIEIFIRLLLKMGIIKLPSLRDYWSQNIGSSDIFQHMARNRFELLMRNWHFVDNNSDLVDKSDKLWKIRPWFVIVDIKKH